MQANVHVALGQCPCPLIALTTARTHWLLPTPHSPLPTLHSEVIDGSWACQLLDRLLYPLCCALCLFSLPAGSLNRLEPLFCFSAATLQPHTQLQPQPQPQRATKNALQRIAPAFIAACCARCSI